MASRLTQARLPSPTPATSSAGLWAPAAPAAAKTAAHEAIVSGFEAVPASEVRKARRGVAAWPVSWLSGALSAAARVRAPR